MHDASIQFLSQQTLKTRQFFIGCLLNLETPKEARHGQIFNTHTDDVDVPCLVGGLGTA